MIPPHMILAALPEVLRTAKWVYDHGFKLRVEGTPGDQYAAFHGEVHGLHNNLQKLQRTLEQAIDTRLHNVPPIESEHDLDLEPFNQLVGDYRITLQACKKLLESNTSFEHAGNGVIRKVLWNAFLADDIAKLRSRIKFHNVRLIAVLKPLELTLYMKMEKDIKNLRQDFREGLADLKAHLRRIEGIVLGNDIVQATEEAEQLLAEPLPAVPSFLRGYFLSNTEREQEVITDQIRLSSLIGHFDNGTRKFQSDTTPSPEPSNYVNLWKAIWLMQQLKGSTSFGQFTDAQLNASVIKEYERLILSETKRFQIGKEELLRDIENLPPDRFIVWIFEPIPPGINFPDPNPNEEKVLECILANESPAETKGLVVLASRTRLNILRVVETFNSTIGGKTDKQRQEFIDVTKVKLFPTYTVPGARLFNLQMRSSVAATMDSSFSFESLEKMHLFQQCLTSFCVEVDLPGLKNVFYKPGGVLFGVRAKVLGNYGRAQIWTHESLKNKPLSTDNNRPGLTSATASSQSASRTINDWASIHAPSVIWRGESADLPYPEAPLVVLILANNNSNSTNLQDSNYYLFALPLDSAVTIDPSRCDCHNRDESCTRVVILSSSRLDAKLFDYGRDVNAMNIAVLRKPIQHDEYKQYVKKLDNIDRVDIEFYNVEDKKDFRKRLREVIDNYSALWQDYKRQSYALQTADYVDQRP